MLFPNSFWYALNIHIASNFLLRDIIHSKECSAIQYFVPTVQRKTFEGESIHEFSGFKATHESFLSEMVASYRSMKVFSLESFPLYSIKEQGKAGLSNSNYL